MAFPIVSLVIDGQGAPMPAQISNTLPQELQLQRDPQPPRGAGHHVRAVHAGAAGDPRRAGHAPSPCAAAVRITKRG